MFSPSDSFSPPWFKPPTVQHLINAQATTTTCYRPSLARYRQPLFGLILATLENYAASTAYEAAAVVAASFLPLAQDNQAIRVGQLHHLVAALRYGPFTVPLLF